MRAVLLVLAVLLASCTPKQEETISDQCMRVRLFQQCLAAAPQSSAGEGRWDKVVDECARAATYQSYRKRALVSDECQAE